MTRRADTDAGEAAAGADDAGAGAAGLTRRELLQGTGAVAAGVLAGGIATQGAAASSTGAAPSSLVLGPGPVRITLTLNGAPRSLEVAPATTLLELLRGELGLTGAKPACERGACGACTVTVDGLAVDACMTFALDVWGRSVVTVEGLARGEALSPLQQAFVEHDALQCGFCTPGMLMAATALLGHTPAPTLADVKRGLAGNLCRCGSYPKIFSATLAAAASPGEPAAPPPGPKARP